MFRMFRRVANFLVVGSLLGGVSVALAAGLGGCASQPPPSIVVASQDAQVPAQIPAQTATAQYRSSEEEPAPVQQAALAPSRSSPITTQPITTQSLQTPTPAQQPVLSNGDQAIVRQLIMNSRMAFGGSCPCPYDRDKAGTCGDRSAYAKGKRNKPLCYPQDVTAEMISRQRRGDAALATGTN